MSGKKKKKLSKRAKRRRPRTIGVYVDQDYSINEWKEIPKHLRSEIKKEGVSRLRRIREDIANDAGLPMPPIRIVPFGYVSPGFQGIIYGLSTIDRIIIPAATLVAVDDDDDLRRILCHEFAHCFWEMIQLVRAMDSGKTVVDTSCGASSNEEIYAVEDKQEKIAKPEEWFGKYDVENFLYFDNDKDSTETQNKMDTVWRVNFEKRWFHIRLPVKVPNFKQKPRSIIVEENVITEHIRSLKRI